MVSAARVVSPLIPLIPAEAIGRPWAVAASQPSGLTQLIAGCQVKKKKTSCLIGILIVVYHNPYIIG